MNNVKWKMESGGRKPETGKNKAERLKQKPES